MAPQSGLGQLFVIIYGLVGIPTTMLVIANLGKFLAETLKASIRPLKFALVELYHCCTSSSQFNKHETLPIIHRKLTHVDANLNPLDEREAPDNNENLNRDAFGLFIAFILYVAIGSVVCGC